MAGFCEQGVEYSEYKKSGVISGRGLNTSCKKFIVTLTSFTNFNAQFLYSLTICMLRYNSRHVSSINMSPSSGGQIVLSQYLVLSLSVKGCTVCRMKADCSAVCSHPA